MDCHCVNHPERKAFSFCNSCKRYFCLECLTEGGEFYFCSDPACQAGLQQDMDIAKEMVNKKTGRANLMKKMIRLLYLLGLGYFYYFAYILIRLALIPFLMLMPYVLPHELLNDTATIITNIFEAAIAATVTGIAMSMLIVRIYRNKALIFGSLAILVYLLISVAMLFVRYQSVGTGDPAWVSMVRYGRPFFASVIFYFVLIYMIKRKKYYWKKADQQVLNSNEPSIRVR